MNNLDMVKKISAFEMSGTVPFVGFGTGDFTLAVHMELRALVGCIDDAVEADINPEPLRAALAGLELLVALAALSESCREYSGAAK